ncbi:hypothetical protein [Actinomyces gaoshouyii]|uniref:Nitroreductase domain-containing protein n=1 Tax=Actinomyces gaoshouyii TaxID=1960083 RepID=A0A8H9H714_9ACTO|nr:hypothetical protein [Actinomyces gaoshouyii]GGO95606.1 hypothetical protein GCM10011612_03870 [Actinomyces gaoshouyii]
MSDDTSPALGTAPPGDPARRAQYLSNRYGAQPRGPGVDPCRRDGADAPLRAGLHPGALHRAPAGATIIAAAQSAPTSSNLHLWSVIVVNDAVLRDRIGPGRLLNQSENFVFIQQAPTILLLVPAASRNEDIMTAAGASTGSLDYLDS